MGDLQARTTELKARDGVTFMTEDNKAFFADCQALKAPCSLPNSGLADLVLKRFAWDMTNANPEWKMLLPGNLRTARGENSFVTDSQLMLWFFLARSEEAAYVVRAATDYLKDFISSQCVERAAESGYTPHIDDIARDYHQPDYYGSPPIELPVTAEDKKREAARLAKEDEEVRQHMEEQLRDYVEGEGGEGDDMEYDTADQLSSSSKSVSSSYDPSSSLSLTKYERSRVAIEDDEVITHHMPAAAAAAGKLSSD